MQALRGAGALEREVGTGRSQGHGAPRLRRLRCSPRSAPVSLGSRRIEDRARGQEGAGRRGPFLFCPSLSSAGGAQARVIRPLAATAGEAAAR